MFCVVQEIGLKKPNKHGHPKELISSFMQMSFRGQDCSHYWYHYSQECFERAMRKAYKISLHQSRRENGRIRKKQFPLCTVNYYDLVDGWFTLYDYCDRKISAAAIELGCDADVIYEIVQAKLDPLIERIRGEYQETEEYKTHEEHERITTLYAARKAEFNKKYGYEGSSHKYDEIYDVYGNFMNKKKLDEVEEVFRYQQQYEEASRSYQKQHYSNYKNNYSGYGSSSYSSDSYSNHNAEDKETLKQFYRALSKKFHPDANPDTDTSKQMQLLNQIKNQWGI